MIVIENGCMFNQYTNSWMYIYEDINGVHEVDFTATQQPKIGDSIDLGTFSLVPLVGYRINNDPGKAQGKQLEDQEWPSRIRSQ